MTEFSATDVRYIKLGSGGQWEESCLFRDHTIMLGYENPHHSESLAGNWKAVRAYWLAHRNDEGAATRDVNQIRNFYEMPESCPSCPAWERVSNIGHEETLAERKTPRCWATDLLL